MLRVGDDFQRRVCASVPAPHTPPTHTHTRPHTPTHAHFSHNCCLEPPWLRQRGRRLALPASIFAHHHGLCVFTSLRAVATRRLFHELRGHANRVSTVGVNTTGNALCTGSWDQALMVCAAWLARCVWPAVWQRFSPARVVDAVCEVVALLHVCIASAPV